MVLCRGTGTSQPVVYQHTQHGIRQQKSALTRIFCLMYCMVFCVFGLVFPICDVLTKSSGDHHLYSELFLILVMLLSIIILGYFFIYILRQGGKRSAAAGRDELELRAIENRLASSESSIDIKVEGKVAVVPNGPSNGTHGHRATFEPPSSTEIGPPLSMAEEGLNLYTRIGTVVFAAGALILKVFRISEPFEDSMKLIECVSKIYIFTQVVFLVFLTMETVFIFKFHQVVINKHKPFVRLCLMHLIATNLSVWLSACTTEIVEDVGEMFAEKAEGETNTNETLRCYEVTTLADKVSPYTFPCLIEFSLIAASAAFRMYLNVGKVIEQEQAEKDGEGSEMASHRSLTSQRSEHVKVTCASFKSLWRGFDNIIWIVFGFIVSLFVIVGVVIFLGIREGDLEVLPAGTSTYIYLSTDLVALVSCLVAVCFGFKYIHTLKFHQLEEDSFDDKLLIMSQAGVFTYSTLLAISAIANLASGFKDIMYLYLLRAILNFVQSGMQTVFVLDSMRRCAGHEDHVRRKPGRATISFLVMVNLALWLVNTFEMEKAEVSGVKIVYFDRVSWSVLAHMLVPLVIFYRYHTTVCLSDVWINAYERRKEE